jgi:hypothetical protein
VELGFGVAVVNGCCAIPRSLVKRPLRELPSISYVAFARKDASAFAGDLVATLVAYAGAWRSR